MTEADRLRAERDHWQRLAESESKSKVRLIRKCDEQFAEIERLFAENFALRSRSNQVMEDE